MNKYEITNIYTNEVIGHFTADNEHDAMVQAEIETGTPLEEQTVELMWE